MAVFNLLVLQVSVVCDVAHAIVEADPSTVFVDVWISDIFPGLVFEAILGQDTILSIEGVSNVWQSRLVSPPTLP